MAEGVSKRLRFGIQNWNFCLCFRFIGQAPSKPEQLKISTKFVLGGILSARYGGAACTQSNPPVFALL